MIKCCSVIYNPGYGGNFFARVLSLSKETVPYLYKNIREFSDLEIKNLQKMSVLERYDILKYQGLKSYINWHSDRLKRPDIFYSNPEVDNFFEWAILTNHFNDIVSPRLEYIKKIIWVDLDLSMYRDWIYKSYHKITTQIEKLDVTDKFSHADWSTLSEKNIIESKKIRQELLHKYPMCDISMTNILSSTNGFIEEYKKACDFLEITTEIEPAVIFYQEWYDWRYRKIMED